MLNHATTTTLIACAGLLASVLPVQADTCPLNDPPSLSGRGHTLVIARPEGQEMCVTLKKSAGLAAGRVTVLTVRPVLNASAADIDVLVTKERTASKGSRPHHAADLSAPDLLGGAQVFVNTDEDRHLTVRVRPRHGRNYRLAIIAHEIDIAEVIGVATVNAIAHIALDAVVQELGGKDAKLPFFDRRVLNIGLKVISGTVHGHSAEEIVSGIAIKMAIKEIMAGADVPREVATVVATFVGHAWREVTRNALRPFEWPLPDDVRDTSQPRLIAN